MANTTAKALLTNSELMVFNILLPMISLIGFVTNFIVILSVFCYRSLRRTPAYIFVVNLAIADIIVLIVGIPMWLVQLILASNTTIAQAMTMCQITFGFTVFSSILSIFTLGMISYDRYNAVTRPFQYHEVMTPAKTYKCLVAVWIITLIFSLPSFVGWKAENLLTSGDPSLIAYCVYTKTFNKEYQLILYSGAALTIVLNIILYSQLLKVAKRHAGQIEGIKSEVENSVCESVAAHGRRRITQRKENNLKAAKTLGIILGAMIVCWVPFLVVASVDTMKNELYFSVFTVKFIGTISYVNSIINPIIYTYMSRDFKRAVRRILSRKRGIDNLNSST